MTGTATGPDALPSDHKCDHTHVTEEGRIWRCINKPHPRNPASHYMRRDEVAERRLSSMIGRRIVTDDGAR